MSRLFLKGFLKNGILMNYLGSFVRVVSWMIACFAPVSGYAQLNKPIQVTSLYKTFQNPLSSARPRVWWHWMNGNVTLDGIRKDLLWMHKSGIGGFHHFDAGLSTPLIVPTRLTFMSPE